MASLEEKLKAYSNAWWSNSEIAIVTGYSYAEVSKIKQQIVRAGGSVIGHGQKVYRDIACKVLGIDYKKEIEILKMIMN